MESLAIVHALLDSPFGYYWVIGLAVTICTLASCPSEVYEFADANVLDFLIDVTSFLVGALVVWPFVWPYQVYSLWFDN